MGRCLLYIGCLLAVLIGTGEADRITLNQSQTLDPPVATKLDFLGFQVNVAAQELTVHYRWLSPDDTPIRDADSFNATRTWVCRDIPAPFPDNLHCTGPGTPDACCTGSMTGTCNVPLDDCFTSVFRFQVRAQDVGTPIGIGLRQLIWNQMRQEIRPGVIDGTFD